MSPAPISDDNHNLNDEGGRPRTYDSPEELHEDAQKYFEWAFSHPLYDTKIFAPSQWSKNNEPTIVKVDRKRALTKEGLCAFLKIGTTTWERYQKLGEFRGITERITELMHAYNIEHAAADLMNASLVIRKESLKDKKDHSSEDGTMSPNAATLTAEQAIELLQKHQVSPE